MRSAVGLAGTETVGVGFGRRPDSGVTAGQRGRSAAWGPRAQIKKFGRKEATKERRTKFLICDRRAAPRLRGGPAQRRWEHRNDKQLRVLWLFMDAVEEGSMTRALRRQGLESIGSNGYEIVEPLEEGSPRLNPVTPRPISGHMSVIAEAPDAASAVPSLCRRFDNCQSLARPSRPPIQRFPPMGCEGRNRHEGFRAGKCVLSPGGRDGR